MVSQNLLKAIEEDNLNYILGEGLLSLYDTSSYKEDDIENLKVIKNYLSQLLAPIAKEKGIEVEIPDKIIKVKKALEKVDKEMKDPNNENISSLTKINGELSTLYDSLGAGWILDFVSGEAELSNILKNPELKNGKVLLLEKWEKEDKEQPLETPRRVFIGDKDDWEHMLDENMYRLETPEEVSFRVANTKKERYQALKEVGSIDNVATFTKWWSFVNNLLETKDIISEIVEKMGEISHKKNEIILKGFKDDEEFYSDLLDIMNHDRKKEVYWYHGTSDPTTGYNIVDQGLLLAQHNISTTAYKEFTPEQLLTYSRGFGGEIGMYGVVVIRQPLDETGKPINIIRDNKTDISAVQSGLGIFKQDKFEYIIPSEYIVGYVDKHNHKVHKNPKVLQNDNASPQIIDVEAEKND